MYPGTSLTVDGLNFTGITAINNSLPYVVPVTVFPNPATTEVNLIDLPKGAMSIQIKDLTGRDLKIIEVDSDTVNFSIIDLPEGMYYYSVQDENGDELYKGKLIVKN